MYDKLIEVLQRHCTNDQILLIMAGWQRTDLNTKSPVFAESVKNETYRVSIHVSPQEFRQMHNNRIITSSSSYSRIAPYSV